MKPHIFQLDPASVRYGGPRLCACGLPKPNAVHVDPPEVPEEDVSGRIIGEGNRDGGEQEA